MEYLNDPNFYLAGVIITHIILSLIWVPFLLKDEFMQQMPWLFLPPLMFICVAVMWPLAFAILTLTIPAFILFAAIKLLKKKD